MNYNSLNTLNNYDKSIITSVFHEILNKVKHISVNKVISYLRYIPEQCRMHYNSMENRKLRSSHIKKYHPIKTQRGEIYNAFITEGVGSELCGNHLVIIIQNKKANIYSEKVNILPIEGDGTKVNSNYQMRLSSTDLIDGTLNKDPSRIIVTDITTIDKSRLGKRIGCLTPECLANVDKILKRHLEL